MEAQRGEDDTDADELQRDVGHEGQDAGEGDGEREGRKAEAAADEVGEGDVAVAVAHGPEAGQDQHHVGVGDDSVGYGEEAVGSGAVEGSGDGDDGVGGVEIAADQEPGDPGAEGPAGEAPFFKRGHARDRASPASGPESGAGDQGEEEAEDDEGLGVHCGRC